MNIIVTASTAESPADYTTLSRTVFIPACERSVCVDLVTHEDTIVEKEKLDVFLQMGPALDPSVHVDGHIQITIIDDDSE